MTHYTIMPEDVYWDDKEVSDSYTEIELGGILMQVRMEHEHNRATIIRLLRCSLDDYLNPAYSPGQQISFVPILNKQ
ncbi:YlzJ-like family protein [Paenibacillus bouchesdurhonensis]|uniref:YlzJ-like family protein n=1 Tax=Paenibacillus bouchesdurhonensis TaxID=1870990 RepID=UPI000DA6077C|nr:YlzJ-like family protein [Paenibacillus bouchesdurhonensis]